MKLLTPVRWFVLGLVLALTTAFTPPHDDREVHRTAGLILGQNPEAAAFGLARRIVSLSRRYNLDPLLVLAMIEVESGFQSDVRSHRGAIGLLQVRPIVLKEIGHEINIVDADDLYNPSRNLEVGIHYFTRLLGHYRQDLRRALTAYNIGPTALDEKLAADEAFSPKYYQLVMGWYRRFQRRAATLQHVT